MHKCSKPLTGEDGSQHPRGGFSHGREKHGDAGVGKRQNFARGCGDGGDGSVKRSAGRHKSGRFSRLRAQAGQLPVGGNDIQKGFDARFQARARRVAVELKSQ